LPPARISAPPATASSIHDCTRSRSPVEISADRSVFSSSGSPTTSPPPTDERVEELLAHRFVHVDALGRDARLPAWLKPATDTFLAAVSMSALGSRINGALLPSSRPTSCAAPGFDAPTDFGRAGERDERDIGVIDDRVADGPHRCP